MHGQYGQQAAAQAQYGQQGQSQYGQQAQVQYGQQYSAGQKRPAEAYAPQAYDPSKRQHFG